MFRFLKPQRGCLRAAVRFAQLHRNISHTLIPKDVCVHACMPLSNYYHILHINITHYLCKERYTLSMYNGHLRLPKRVYTAVHTLTQSFTQTSARPLALQRCCLQGPSRFGKVHRITILIPWFMSWSGYFKLQVKVYATYPILRPHLAATKCQPASQSASTPLTLQRADTVQG